MIEIVLKGGLLIYPIILLSVISVAVFLERMMSVKQSSFIPQKFSEDLDTLLANGDYQSALMLCRHDNSSYAVIAGTILQHLDLPISRIMDLAEEVCGFEATKLDKFLPTLQAIASISPLLGLLGTVIGMIKTFVEITASGVGNAQALSGGISEALITTAAGLSVAIPTIIFYYIIKNRAERLELRLQKATSDTLNKIFKEGV